MVPLLREGEFGIIEGLMRDSWPLRSKRHLAGADHGHICGFCVRIMFLYFKETHKYTTNKARTGAGACNSFRKSGAI